MARSSVEAEFRAVAHGICEVLWIKQLLEELKAASPLPMKVFCDNKVDIAIAHNLVLHDRTTHVEVDKHFIKEKLENGLIVMPYIPMVEQVADILTKGLPKKQFDDLVSNLDMNDIFKPAWGGVLRISIRSEKFWSGCYLFFRDNLLLYFRDKLLLFFRDKSYILNLFCS